MSRRVFAVLILLSAVAAGLIGCVGGASAQHRRLLIAHGRVLALPTGRSAKVGSPRVSLPRGPFRGVRPSRAFDRREAARALTVPTMGSLVQQYSSATAQTYRVSTGGFRTEMFTHPVNYRDSSGVWRLIDDAMVSDGSGGYTNKANGWHVRLPGSLFGQTVQLNEPGAKIAFSVLGAGLSPASVSGMTVSYPNVFPHTDMSYVAGPDSVQEQITLRSAAAPSSYRFLLSLPAGWTPKLLAGQVVLFDAAGKRMPELFTTPTVTDGSSAVGGVPGPVGSQLTSTSLGWILSVSVDSAWLRAPDRVFPVTIDPTVSTSAAQTDCWITSQYPTTSPCGSGYMDVGQSGSYRYHALLQFGQLPLPSDAEVLTSTLQVYFAAGTAMANAGAFPMVDQWNSSATWDSSGVNDSATPNGQWITPGGDYSAVPGQDVETIPAQAGYVNWYTTLFMQKWVDGTLANNGIILTDDYGGTIRGAYSVTSGTDVPDLATYWLPRIGNPAADPSQDVPLGNGADVDVNAANGDAEFHFPLFDIAGTGLNFDLGLRYSAFAPYIAPVPGQVAGPGMDFVPGPIMLLANQTIGTSGGAEVVPATWGPDWQLRRWSPQTVNGSTYFTTPGFDAEMFYTYSTTVSTWTMQMNATGETYVFDANAGLYYGVLLEDETRNGEAITYNYGASTFPGYSGTVAYLASITDTQGRTLTPTFTTYTVNGGPETVVSKWTDSTGRTVSFGLNTTTGLTTSITDSGGGSWTIGYNAANDITSVSDPDGNQSSMTYNASSQITGVTRVSNASAGTGPTYSFAYTASPVSSPTAACSTPPVTAPTATVSYYPIFQQTTYTTPNGNNWIYCEDTHDRDVITQDPAGNVTANTYDYSDAVIGSAFTPANSSNAAVVSNTNYQANSAGQGTQEPTVGDDQTPTNSFQISDGSETYPAAQSAANTNQFLPTSATDPQKNPATTYGYDAYGNLTSVLDPLSSQNTINLTYSSTHPGWLTSSTVPDGGQTNYGYDGEGNLTSVAPPSPIGSTTYGYDGLSRMTSMTDGDGNQSSYAYNALDELTQATYAGDQVINYTYDADGNLTSEASPGGIEGNSYNDLGQLTQTTWPGGRTVSYTYDADGNLKTFTDSGGTYTYAYNNLDELTSLTQPDGTLITFAYNPEGDRTQTAYPNGVTLNITYNAADQPTSLTEVTGAGSTTLETYAYDAPSGDTSSDLLSSRTDQYGNVTSYTYDALNRLLTAKTVASSGATISSYSYSYDGSGNMLSSVNNGTSTAYTYNAASEQTSQNGAPETYDAAGNLLSAPGFSSSYNTLEQPSSIDGNAYSFLGPGENLQINQGSSTLLNSALGVSAVITGSESDFISRDSYGMPLGENAVSGDEYFVDDPVTGSVISVLSSTGQPVRTSTYDPYGGLTTSGTGADDIGWDGNTNAQAGIYHFGVRQYWVGADRWTQSDPASVSLISDPTQADPYVFAGDDPINSLDLAGTDRGTAGGYADDSGEGDVGGADGVGAGAGDYDDDGASGGTERMGPGRYSSNSSQKAQIDSIAQEYDLSKPERRILHDLISGQHLSYAEIRDVASEIIHKGRY